MTFRKRALLLVIVFLTLNAVALLFGIWWFLPNGQQRIPNPTEFECWMFFVSGQLFGFVSLIQYPFVYLASLPFRQLAFPYRTILFVFLNSVFSGLFYAWVAGLFLSMWRYLSEHRKLTGSWRVRLRF
jgi:hypothetical protein